MFNYKMVASDYICNKYNWDDVAKRTLELYQRHGNLVDNSASKGQEKKSFVG